MAYTTVHIEIAKRIFAENPGRIQSFPDYLLGSAAPDAVHIREPYNSDMKKLSHASFSPEKWGHAKDCDKWQKDALDFYRGNANSENRSYLLGYLSHILVDIENNRIMWGAFRDRCNAENHRELLPCYRRDSIVIESLLCERDPDMPTLRMQLITGKAYPLPDGYVTEAEVYKARESFLSHRRIPKAEADAHIFTACTPGQTDDFIDICAKELPQLIFALQ